MQTIRELQSLLEESKAAVEDSEKRLEAKNRSISDMKGTLDPLHPASTTIFNRGRKVDAHPTPVVMVTPLRNAQPSQSVCGKSDDEESVPQELEVQKETEVCPSPLLIPGTPSPVRTPCQPRPLPHFKESPFVGNSSKHIIPSTPEMIATKTEKNRVLRVVVTPIQKLIFKQTKTSLMRLRLTPNKSASSTPKQSKTSLMRLRLTPNKSASSTPKQSPAAPITRNTRRGKRTISEVDPTPTPDHTTKVGRTQQVQNKGRVNKLKKRSSLASRIKYNLRARCWKVGAHTVFVCCLLWYSHLVGLGGERTCPVALMEFWVNVTKVACCIKPGWSCEWMWHLTKLYAECPSVLTEWPGTVQVLVSRNLF